jgi:hypothetical protein
VDICDFVSLTVLHPNFFVCYRSFFALKTTSTGHMQATPDHIKQRGFEHIVLLTRNLLKRMLAYAISSSKTQQQLLRRVI